MLEVCFFGKKMGIFSEIGYCVLDVANYIILTTIYESLKA